MYPLSYAKNLLNSQWREFKQVPFKVIRHECGYDITRPTNWHWDFAHQRLYYCRDIWEILSPDWTVIGFMNSMSSGSAPAYTGKRRSYSRRSESSSSKFTQHGIEKKHLSDKDSDKRWRRKQKKGKHRATHYYRRGPGKWYKKESNRTHRNQVATLMKHSKYDELEPFNSQRRVGCYYDWW